MEDSIFLDALKEMNTLLDVQLSRLDSIERNNPNQAQYLKQIHKAFFKGECCAPCYVIPSESDCTGGGSIISCDGATDQAGFTKGSRAFHITVNGEFYENLNNWDVGYMINYTPELDVIIGYGGEGGFIIFNKSSDFLRIKLEPVGGDVWGIYEENNNPTIDISDEGVIQFCLAPIDTNNSRYTLTVDDKGIFPSDNIYSGTISPPNPSLYLTFRIQWFSDMNMNEGTRNSRVLYVDSDYMQFSLDGSTWSVNLNSLQSSLLPNHMDESGFYELAIFPIAGLNDPSFEIISKEIYYPYSPIEEPEFGEWQLDRSEHDQVGSLFNYFGAKGNGNITYNSVATFNVSSALVQAMVSDQGYREWEAVKQAVNELTGVTDWVLDPANNQIVYTDPSKPVDPQDPTVQYYYYITNSAGERFEGASAKDACKPYIESSGMVYDGVEVDPQGRPTSCNGHRLPSTTVYSFGNLSKVTNPAYDPAAEPSEDDKKTLPLETVAQKVISNAESSVEITEMMANTFIQAVKDSALNPDENKQIIKYVDILEQWEENKWQLV